MVFPNIKKTLSGMPKSIFDRMMMIKSTNDVRPPMTNV
jgi:hypothetical protein